MHVCVYDVVCLCDTCGGMHVCCIVFMLQLHMDAWSVEGHGLEVWP